MIGLTIFTHSLRQVLGNIGMAVRISGWLLLIWAVLGIVLVYGAPDWLVMAVQGVPLSAENEPDIGPAGLLFIVIGIIGAAVFFCWAISLVAIAWHRFILLEEYPTGFIPYRAEFKIGRYFWVGVGISLLAAFLVGIVSAILGMVFGPFFMNSVGTFAQTNTLGFIGSSFLIGMILGIIVAVIYLRMALTLPAIALDEGMTIGKAWEATSGYTAAIFVLALVLAFINVVVSMGLQMALDGWLSDWFYLVISGLYQWFYFMLNISVLSTLYGYIVQKREIF